MHLDKTIPIAAGIGAAAGAYMAPKAVDLPENTPATVGSALVAGGVVVALLAYLAPLYPKTIGALSLVSGALSVYSNGLNLGAAGALGIGGALAFGGNAEYHKYAALGLYAFGGSDIAQGVLVAKRLSEYNALPPATRAMLRGGAPAPVNASPSNV